MLEKEELIKLSKTPNYKAIQKQIGNLKKRNITIALTKEKVNTIILDNINIITNMLTERNKPILRIDENNVLDHFELLAIARKQEYVLYKLKQTLNNHIQEYENKINKAHAKGKFKQVQEYKGIKEMLENPFDGIDQLREVQNTANQLLVSGEILKENRVFKQIQQLENAYSIAINLYNQIDNLTDTEEILYKENIHTELRKNIVPWLMNFKKDYIGYVTTVQGNIVINSSNISLVLKCIEKEGTRKALVKKLKPILEYLRLEDFYCETYDLVNTPKFSINMELKMGTISVENIQYYFSTKAIEYMVPKGYVGYEFKPKFMCQQSLLTLIQPNLNVAKLPELYSYCQDVLANYPKGLFYNFLTKEEQEDMFFDNLGADAPIQNINTTYMPLVIKQEKFTRYNTIVPICMEVMGSYITTFLKVILESPHIFIYYVGVNKLGIAIRENKLSEVDDLIGTFWEHLREIKEPKINNIVKEG